MKALNLPRCLLQRWTLIENLWQLQTDVLMSGIGLCGTVDPKHKNNGSYASKVVASTITNQGDGSISSLMDKEMLVAQRRRRPVPVDRFIKHVSKAESVSRFVVLENEGRQQLPQ
ncbi:hypothetical protein V6N11_008908 [Hibiscus sabdariffa]|uniref:Uncharacterized protein n=1 Tax=Hibiscus sabdariffa TaxID=183260 RepID=A0ABR2PP27_9ROSI